MCHVTSHLGKRSDDRFSSQGKTRGKVYPFVGVNPAPCRQLQNKQLHRVIIGPCKLVGQLDMQSTSCVRQNELAVATKALKNPGGNAADGSDKSGKKFWPFIVFLPLSSPEKMIYIRHFPLSRFDPSEPFRFEECLQVGEGPLKTRLNLPPPGILAILEPTPVVHQSPILELHYGVAIGSLHPEPGGWL